MITQPVTCVVVADGARARFFCLKAGLTADFDGGAELEERADLVHAGVRHPATTGEPSGTDRQRAAAGGPGRDDDGSEASRRRDADRRFAGQIIDQCADLCRAWPARNVILIADKHTLGLLRQKTHRLNGVDVQELARDLSRANAAAVHAHLKTAGLVRGMAGLPVGLAR